MLSFVDMAVTEEEADAYAASRGLDAWYYDAPALRRGQDYIATRFNSAWKTEWENDDAPDLVKYAIVEAALYELLNPGALSPQVIGGQRVKRLREKVGPLEEETEYATSGDAVQDATVRLTAVERLLASLVSNLGSSVRLIRA